MPRKTTTRSAGADAGAVMERTEHSLAVPPTPGEERPGSAVSLEMVNVFGEPVSDGSRLRLTAWVNNVSYVKNVWVDAYVTDAGGGVGGPETHMLDYREGAGGGGDFFSLDASLPSKATGVQYRLYYDIGDTVYTDGILHKHAFDPGPFQAVKKAAAASKPATRPPPPAADKPAAKRPTKVAATDGKASNGQTAAKPAKKKAVPKPGPAAKRTPPRTSG